MKKKKIQDNRIIDNKIKSNTNGEITMVNVLEFHKNDFIRLILTVINQWFYYAKFIDRTAWI